MVELLLGDDEFIALMRLFRLGVGYTLDLDGPAMKAQRLSVANIPHTVIDSLHDRLRVSAMGLSERGLRERRRAGPI